MFLLAATTACAPKHAPPSFVYDKTASFSDLETYAWFDYRPPGRQPDRGSAVVDAQFMDRTTRQAVDQNLERRGFARSADDTADIFVTYYLGDAGSLSQDRYTKTSTTDFLLWSWDHLDYDGTNVVRATSLMLEIRDRHLSLIWQGVRTWNVGTTPEAMARGIQKSVDDLLSNFPPVRAGKDEEP